MSTQNNTPCPTNSNPSTDRIIHLPGVLATLGTSRSALYAGVKSGRFPKPVQLGKRAVGWRDSEIQALLASLPKKG